MNRSKMAIKVASGAVIVGLAAYLFNAKKAKSDILKEENEHIGTRNDLKQMVMDKVQKLRNLMNENFDIVISVRQPESIGNQKPKNI